MTSKKSTSREPSKAKVVPISKVAPANSLNELLDWRIAALKLEALNLGPGDISRFSEDEMWDIVSRGATAISSAFEQVRRELHIPIPDDEIQSNYLAMKNLHVVARDGYVAMFWLAKLLVEGREDTHVEARRELAKAAALARLLNDPKQAEMKEIHAEWLRWQEGEAQYKSDADFARRMMQRTIHLTSEGSIKNAISRWRRE